MLFSSLCFVLLLAKLDIGDVKIAVLYKFVLQTVTVHSDEIVGVGAGPAGTVVPQVLGSGGSLWHLQLFSSKVIPPYDKNNQV